MQAVMPMVKTKPLILRSMRAQDDLPFPKSWDEIKSEVVQWSFGFGYTPTPKDVIEYLEQNYLPPFERSEPEVEED
jgi:hypothetical protein